MQVVKLKQKYTFTPFGDRRHKEKCSEKINIQLIAFVSVFCSCMHVQAVLVFCSEITFVTFQLAGLQ